MKNYYKIDDDKNVFITTGIDAPEGFTEFTYLTNGDYPTEVANALLEEKSISDRNDKVNESKAYLKDTDWYYARKLEINEDVPVDVVNKRTEARNYLRANGY